MKHLSKLLALLLIAGALVACSKDEVPEPNRTPLDPSGNIRFPDAKFAAYMVENFDTDGDGGISPAEAAQITKIECLGMGIESVAGIEYCTELTYLDCSHNYKNQLPPSNYNRNKLTALDVSKNTKLTKLWCYYNQLTSLDISKNTALTNLHCGRNQLTTLDVSKNTKLDTLGCDGNQLTALDVGKNTELTDLWCGGNQLTALDISKNTELTDLNCDSNQLTALDVSKNTALTNLYCSNNQLTALDVSKNTALTNLYCSNNQLTALDVSKNTKLKDLSCSNNQLTTLDVSKTNLGNSNYIYPLSCNMESLQTLYLKTGWKIKYINNPRDADYIHPNTQIVYKD